MGTFRGQAALAALSGVGIALLALGLASLGLALAWRRISWFLAAVGIPGAVAGLAGASVWTTHDLSYRWWLAAAPIAAAGIFAVRRQGIMQTALAAITSGVVAVTFFFLGAGVLFLYAYRD